jgi:3-dehydrotetronate 4-kinase
MRLGCIADDYTGATDLSSMLVRAGQRVVQVFGPESKVELLDADAVVLSLKSRSIPAVDAVEQSLRALHFLQSIGVQRYFFKYCSTFDSTPAGNIGPVAEALADALNADRLWYCPSFPENGRTVYCGHMFVNGVPLNESGMKDHPLNPMTDSSLVRILQAQCNARVDFLPLDEVRAGDASRCENPHAARHWIVDAISDADLRQIAQLARDQVLLTGGSAIARFWAEAATPRGHNALERERAIERERPAGQAVILAGSCSLATRRQIDSFSAASRPVMRLDVIAAADSEAAFQSVVARAVSCCLEHTDSPVLIESGAEANAVAAAVACLGELRAAQLTESLFAAIAKKLAAQGVKRIIVAGGETSGAVVNALGIDAIRIGEEIASGVPCVHTLRAPYVSLALKSGNFGGVDFFMDAVRKLA